MGSLTGKRILIVIAEGYHEHEFWFPYYRFLEAGAEVVTAGPKPGPVVGEGRHGKDGLLAEVDCSVEDAAGRPFDCVFLPGGIYGPLTLRNHRPTLKLVKEAMDRRVIVGAICHAQWILVSAGVVAGRSLTCPPDMADDVRNAGGVYLKEKCVVDGNLVTAVYFAYLPAMFQALIPLLAGR